MKALISPLENNRIAQVSEQSFEVAPPLYWVDCPMDCVADQWAFIDGTFTPPAPIAVITPTQAV